MGNQLRIPSSAIFNSCYRGEWSGEALSEISARVCGNSVVRWLIPRILTAKYASVSARGYRACGRHIFSENQIGYDIAHLAVSGCGEHNDKRTRTLCSVVCANSGHRRGIGKWSVLFYGRRWIYLCRTSERCGRDGGHYDTVRFQGGGACLRRRTGGFDPFEFLEADWFDYTRHRKLTAGNLLADRAAIRTHSSRRACLASQFSRTIRLPSGRRNTQRE